MNVERSITDLFVRKMIRRNDIAIAFLVFAFDERKWFKFLCFWKMDENIGFLFFQDKQTTCGQLHQHFTQVQSTLCKTTALGTFVAVVDRWSLLRGNFRL